MRRADRLFEIIQILRRVRRPVSAQAIADELERVIAVDRLLALARNRE